MCFDILQTAETIWQLSRGEICVKNLIPPANGMSYGSFCTKQLISAIKHYKNNTQFLW